MEMNFESEYSKEMDEEIHIYYRSIDEAKEARRKEFEKQYNSLREKVLDLFDSIDDSIDAAYDEIEQGAREKCEENLIKIREKHYKREG
jgi:hypothetical protein